MVHNPGGDSYWEGGQPNIYIFYIDSIRKNKLVNIS